MKIKRGNEVCFKGRFVRETVLFLLSVLAFVLTWVFKRRISVILICDLFLLVAITVTAFMLINTLYLWKYWKKVQMVLAEQKVHIVEVLNADFFKTRLALRAFELRSVQISEGIEKEMLCDSSIDQCRVFMYFGDVMMYSDINPNQQENKLVVMPKSWLTACKIRKLYLEYLKGVNVNVSVYDSEIKVHRFYRVFLRKCMLALSRIRSRV